MKQTKEQELIKIGFDFGLNAKEHHKKCKYCKYCFEHGKAQALAEVEDMMINLARHWIERAEIDIDELKQNLKTLKETK